MQRTRTSAAAAVRVDTCEKAGNLDDTAYNRFLKAFQARVSAALLSGEPVFEITACGEAYSKEGTLEGRDEADVAGISLEKGWCQATVRVARPSKVFKIYKIDRWE